MGLPNCKIIYDALSKGKKDCAIECLKGWLESGTKRKLREMIKKAPSNWFAEHHFFFGMAIRNHLRQSGFGESYFGINNLDDIYVELLEEAVK